MARKYVPEILLVSADRTLLMHVNRLLNSTGCCVTSIDSFKDAKAWVLGCRPDLLIADVRLGDFNGLHLAWLRYFADPARPSIIVHTHHDRSLERESRKLGAPFVVIPAQDSRLLRLVDDRLEKRHAAEVVPFNPSIHAMNILRRRLSQRASSLLLR